MPLIKNTMDETQRQIQRRLMIIKRHMKWNDLEIDDFFEKLCGEFNCRFKGYKKRRLYSAGEYDEINIERVLDIIINSMDMRLMPCGCLREKN